MNRFSIICPMFNASKTLARMLHSVMGQSYENWRLILIDDVSSIDEVDRCERIIDQFDLLDTKKRIKIIYNDEKKWEVANVLKGISLCDDDDIIVRLDADDFLSDLDAFRIIDQVYQHRNCDVLWSNHRWFDDTQITNMNISGPLPQHLNPYKELWVTSHLKTFRKKLINDVNDENFRGSDGDYIRRAGDQAIYLPILAKSQKRLHLPMCFYSYRCDLSPSTFQTDDAKFQSAEAQFLRNRGLIK